MKKFILFILPALLLFCACERPEIFPTMTQPGSGITAVNMVSPQIENTAFPVCRAFVLVTDQASLLIDRNAVDIDFKPEMRAVGKLLKPPGEASLGRIVHRMYGRHPDGSQGLLDHAYAGPI